MKTESHIYLLYKGKVPEKKNFINLSIMSIDLFYIPPGYLN